MDPNREYTSAHIFVHKLLYQVFLSNTVKVAQACESLNPLHRTEGVLVNHLRVDLKEQLHCSSLGIEHG